MVCEKVGLFPFEYGEKSILYSIPQSLKICGIWAKFPQICQNLWELGSNVKFSQISQTDEKMLWC